jgi:hypothetical protein
MNSDFKARYNWRRFDIVSLIFEYSVSFGYFKLIRMEKKSQHFFFKQTVRVIAYFIVSFFFSHALICECSLEIDYKIVFFFSCNRLNIATTVDHLALTSPLSLYPLSSVCWPLLAPCSVHSV